MPLAKESQVKGTSFVDRETLLGVALGAGQTAAGGGGDRPATTSG